jgi:hypothetical protein
LTWSFLFNDSELSQIAIGRARYGTAVAQVIDILEHHPPKMLARYNLRGQEAPDKTGAYFLLRSQSINKLTNQSKAKPSHTQSKWNKETKRLSTGARGERLISASLKRGGFQFDYST